jgi:PHD/YefM family antitoxin component YafN of YafNO toxin-antitoxin module
MEHDTNQKTEVLFSREQLVNTATVARHFGKVKITARVKPLFITDNGEVDLVLMSYSAYEQMYTRLMKLESEVIEHRAEKATNYPDSLVDWREVRRSE